MRKIHNENIRIGDEVYYLDHIGKVIGYEVMLRTGDCLTVTILLPDGSVETVASWKVEKIS